MDDRIRKKVNNTNKNINNDNINLKDNADSDINIEANLERDRIRKKTINDIKHTELDNPENENLSENKTNNPYENLETDVNELKEKTLINKKELEKRPVLEKSGIGLEVDTQKLEELKNKAKEQHVLAEENKLIKYYFKKLIENIMRITRNFLFYLRDKSRNYSPFQKILFYSAIIFFILLSLGWSLNIGKTTINQVAPDSVSRISLKELIDTNKEFYNNIENLEVNIIENNIRLKSLNKGQYNILQNPDELSIIKDDVLYTNQNSCWNKEENAKSYSPIELILPLADKLTEYKNIKKTDDGYTVDYSSQLRGYPAGKGKLYFDETQFLKSFDYNFKVEETANKLTFNLKELPQEDLPNLKPLC